MDSKSSKKLGVLPRYHLVYVWHRSTRRFIHVGSCFCLDSDFSAVDFIAASSLKFRAFLRRHNYDLSSCIAMPCSVWYGFSTNELPF